MKKGLGQHLLKDPSYLEKIAAAVNPKPEEVVIEIGAGTGNLTEYLAHRGCRIVAVEKDPELAALLKQKNLEGVEVVVEDVLELDPRQFAPQAVAVGNLPYYISSKILRWFLEWRQVFHRGGFLLQEEVARRFAAERGRDVTPLSLLLHNFYQVEYCFTVPAGAFIPPPKVKSGFILLKRRQSPLYFLKDLEDFETFLRQCFSSRRKTVFNNLRRVYPELVLEGIDRRSRVEELALGDFVRMYGIIKKNAAAKN